VAKLVVPQLQFLIALAVLFQIEQHAADRREHIGFVLEETLGLPEMEQPGAQRCSVHN
jgi:hypothetical protein